MYNLLINTTFLNSVQKVFKDKQILENSLQNMSEKLLLTNAATSNSYLKWALETRPNIYSHNIAQWIRKKIKETRQKQFSFLKKYYTALQCVTIEI